MARKKEENPDAALLKRSRDALRERIDAESDERKKMLDDMKFCTLDQWDSRIRAARESDPNGARPCLTVDKINQYVVQVTNDMRQNRPSIKVRPVDDWADVKTAKVLQGLVRHIEDQSNAGVAYETAGESAVKVGLGFFRITTDYVSPDSFDQEIFIRRIPSMFSVYLGAHIMPDGSDSEEGWIFEDVPLARFKREFPGKKWKAAEFDDLGETQPDWVTDTTVRVCEYFYKQYTERELLFLTDGSSVYADEWEKLPEELRIPIARDETGVEHRRKTSSVSVKWCKHTGIEVLEKRDWAGKYIPIVEVIGKEAWLDGKRHLWGLVRPAKDTLRMYNYWVSAATEKVALSTKAPYIGAKGQFKGVENQWKKANTENRPYLEYEMMEVNGNAVPAPQRTAPSQIEHGIMAMLPLIEHDVQTSLGMFKASVGESESQQSGRAILALQRESDTGTFHFQDNLSISIRHAGKIIVDLAPKVYDTRRTKRILGDDGESSTVTIDPEQQESHREIQTADGVEHIYNPGVGEFDTTVTVGPSYNTKRMEAAEVMLEMVKSQPDLMKVMGHIMFRNMDFPGADEIAKVMKRLMPPQLQDEQAPIPPQAAAQIEQLTQAVQLLQAENQELESGAKEAAAKIQVQHTAKMNELRLRAAAEEEEARLARKKAEDEIALKRWIAEQEIAIKRMVAMHDTKVSEHEMRRDDAEVAHDMQLKHHAAMQPQQ